MGHKSIRRNYYQNRSSKRFEETSKRLKLAFKLLSGAIILTVMSCLFVFGHDYLTQCEYFKTKQFTVSGQQRLSAKQIIGHAQLDKGMNILSVNLSVVRKKLLNQSWISEAEVRRELPDRIHINIREHRPLAILDFGRRFILNSQGDIFKEFSPADPADLPVISGLKVSDINSPGKNGSPAFEAVMVVLKLGEKSGTILPNRLIRKIQVDREIGLTLFAFDDTKVIKLGYKDYHRKYNRLESLLFYFNNGGRFSDFDSIDLNHTNRIVVSPAKDGRSKEDHKEV